MSVYATIPDFLRRPNGLDGDPGDAGHRRVACARWYPYDEDLLLRDRRRGAASWGGGA